MLTLESLQRCLGGKISNGQLRCRGPGHSGADESLSIKLDPNAPDGFVAHSFSDDDPILCRDYIREKCGQAPWKPNGNGHARRSEDEVEAALATAIKRQSADSKSRVVCAYPYSDEGGTLLYEVVRLEPKSFRQRRPDGNGGWFWKLEGVRRVIYRWPEILRYADATIFVCEGEKDADRVASLGHCATTVAGGKWTDECVKAFAGRDCFVLEDNDETGRKKAHEAASALHGTARSVRIVRLPDLPDKGDVSDWLDADTRNAEKLVDICFSASPWQPHVDTVGSDAPPEEPNTASRENTDTSVLDVQPWWRDPTTIPPREFLYSRHYIRRNIGASIGAGGRLKTSHSLFEAVEMTAGRNLATGEALPNGPLRVGCLNAEEEQDELDRRTAAICQRYNVSQADLGGRLFV